MFQFPWLPSTALCVQAVIHKHYLVWVAPFGDLRLITPKCSSPQLITSFIDFLCQGIHRVPLISSSHKLINKVLSTWVDHTNLIFIRVLCESHIAYYS